MRVLLSAYACEPGKGSEPGTGWNTGIGLAKYCDVTVVTRANNRQRIEAELESNPALKCNLQFIYYDLPQSVLKLKTAGLLPMRFYYTLWQNFSYRYFQRNYLRNNFDIVHHLTFNTFEIPSLLYRLNLPFVWGPIGGGQHVTPSIIRWFGCSAAPELLRTIRVYFSRWLPRVKRAKRHCRAIFYANRETLAALPPDSNTTTVEAIDVGVSPCPRKSTLEVQCPARGVILGRLEARKGVYLALECAKHLRQKDIKAHLKFVGDGPLRSYINSYISKNDLHAYLSISPPIAHAGVPLLLRDSDFLLFPSLRDTSGSVVLEAMMCGLPTIALNHQGAALMLNETCGILVNPTPGKTLAARLATSIEELLSNPSRMADFSINAHERALKHFTWDARAKLFTSVYQDILEPKTKLS